MEPFLAEIRMFSGNFAPRGWALCQGQLLNINQYQALYAIIGPTYGGNGTTTFGLPDFRGRLPIHVSQTIALGAKGGITSTILTVNEMPEHSHIATATPVRCLSTVGALANPKDAFPSNSNADASYATTSGTTDFAAADAVAITVATTGNNAPLSNLMPSLSVNFIIALQGIFPPRP